MEALLTVYPGSKRFLGELLRGSADLVFIYLGLGDDPDEAVALATSLVHERGNVVVAGRFPSLARAYFPLNRFGAVLDLAAPVPPVLEGEIPPATGHRLVLVAWKRPDHIDYSEGRRWGPRFVGDTTLLGGRSPLSAREVAAVEEAVLRWGRGFTPLPSRALAALIALYSHPGGLVVDLGDPQGHAAALALALGRRAATYAEGTWEADFLLGLPKAYEAALRRKGPARAAAAR
uniref:Uncharacterized protein n=1 Tax=Thermus caliditerrae TaxID=1330700 RepID=A0A7C5VEW1_9DEIN